MFSFNDIFNDGLVTTERPISLYPLNDYIFEYTYFHVTWILYISRLPLLILNILFPFKNKFRLLVHDPIYYHFIQLLALTVLTLKHQISA